MKIPESVWICSPPKGAGAAGGANGARSTGAPRGVSTAVIVAAGTGSRLGAGIPKPLVPLAGVPLIGRVMRGASKAGIKRFVVVVGHEAALMRRELAGLTPPGCALDVVENREFDKPNGVSLLMAARSLGKDEPFALLMSDHIFSPDRLRTARARFAQTGRNLLVTERREDFTGDAHDATLVKAENNRVRAIGKGLKEYKAVDTGMFILVAGDAAKALEKAGSAPSISDGMRLLAEAGELDALELREGWWQDVDTPGDFREAEEKLYDSLRKPADGVLARLINRRVSLSLTRRLWPLGVTPNMVTAFTLLLGILSGWCFSRGSGAGWGLAGALFFQLQSIIDGVDGELARLLHRESRFGFWFDVAADNLTHVMVFGGIALGRIAGGESGPWAALGVLSCLGVAVSFAAASPLLDPARLPGGGGPGRLGKMVVKLSTRDFSYLLFPLAALGWLGGFLWVATLGVWVYAAAAISLRLRSRARA